MMNILIIDDHPVVLDGTKTLLQDLVNVQIETEQDSTAVIRRMDTEAFQLFLIDINMKPINGIQLAEMIKKKQPDALIILYTGYELSDYYELLIEKKIDGLLSKLATKEQVIQTIQAALRGEILLAADFLDFVQQRSNLPNSRQEVLLSDKEQEILQLVAQGCTNKAIASAIGVTQRTVENYLSKLFVKLNVESRAEAVIVAKEKAWID
ncbi:response regulator [Lysinibacillus sp. fkY74-1]|uniref:ComA, srfB, comAA two-component response regulator. potential cognate sensor kinase is comP n=4 Tax=Lysinibacillus TaxID=400634 RepID=B1HZD2_LYSSC|nr:MULTISPECIES: response regulator transcription factor [Lysinibacillus]EWH32261.1 regulator [Lysinibacillus sphaericus CBAM5]MBE5083231.1 response regulator transcription factor [Bacillus thuringiensis]ACA40229.1 comA, srfB, comAA; two-component response regulator. potential cognate sensor kinase is comP [Lysinibacillus sphaericus C3-41]AMO33720.1 DNA-binding response regulator [Lysinibacillus sphaericus]AMR91171.1 DNA-binding response regulator [Lysinibacillus sphaericus]